MSLMTSALLLQWSELSPYFIWLNNNIWQLVILSTWKNLQGFLHSICPCFSSVSWTALFNFIFRFFFPSWIPKYCSAPGLSPWSFSLFYLHSLLCDLIPYYVCISDDSQNLHFRSRLCHTANCVLNFSTGVSNWQINLKVWNNTKHISFQ